MKAMSVYNLTGVLGINSAAVEAMSFTPPESTQQQSIGFVATPFGEFVSEVKGVKYLRVCKQVKKPDAQHLKHIVERKKTAAFETQGRQVSKKEINLFKEEALFELLPQTFPKDPVYMDIFITKDKVFVTSNNRQADEITSFLRKAIGTLPIIVWADSKDVHNVLDMFVNEEITDNFTLGDRVVLEDEECRKVSITKGSVYKSDAQNLLKDGGVTTELELEYDGVFKFVLKDTGEFTSIKFDKSFAEEADDLGGTLLMKAEMFTEMFDILFGIEG